MKALRRKGPSVSPRVLEWVRYKFQYTPLLRHLATLISGTAVAQLLPILAAPIISRLYSPQEVGIYAAFMSLVGMVTTIATWRYDLTIVLPEKPEDARALVKLATRLNSATCVVVGLVLVILARPVSEALGNPALKPWLAGVGLVAWASSQLAILNYWLNRNQEYRLMASSRIIQSVATTGTQVAGGVVALGAGGLIVGALVGQVVAAGRLLRRKGNEIYRQPTSSLRRVFFTHKDMPLISTPTAAIDSLRLNGIQLLIGAYFSAAALGQFSQAWRLLQTPIGLITSSLSQVFFQKLTQTQPGQMRRIILNSIGHTAVIGAVPFALIWLLAPHLFAWVFGAPWAQAGAIAAALAPWLYISFITSPISFLFLVVRRQGVLFWYSIPYAAAPLWVIWKFHYDLLTTVTYVAWTMVGMLSVFLCLALWVAWEYDRGGDSEHDGSTA